METKNAKDEIVPLTFEYTHLDKNGMIYLFLAEPAPEDFDLYINIADDEDVKPYEILNEKIEKRTILEAEN